MSTEGEHPNIRLLLELRADARKMHRTYPYVLLVGHGACLLFLYQSLLSGHIRYDADLATLGWVFVCGACAAFLALVNEANLLDVQTRQLQAHILGNINDVAVSNKLINFALGSSGWLALISALLLLHGASAPLRDVALLVAGP